MMTYKELKTLNGEIVLGVLRENRSRTDEHERLVRIAEICESSIAKNEALKRRLTRDVDYQLKCHAIDARSLPLKEILGIAKGGCT